VRRLYFFFCSILLIFAARFPTEALLRSSTTETRLLTVAFTLGLTAKSCYWSALARERGSRTPCCFADWRVSHQKILDGVEKGKAFSSQNLVRFRFCPFPSSVTPTAAPTTTNSRRRLKLSLHVRLNSPISQSSAISTSNFDSKQLLA